MAKAINPTTATPYKRKESYYKFWLGDKYYKRLVLVPWLYVLPFKDINEIKRLNK